MYYKNRTQSTKRQNKNQTQTSTKHARNKQQLLPIRNCASILYRFCAIVSYLSKVANFNLLHLHLVLPLWWPRSNFANVFGIRNLFLKEVWSRHVIH